MKWFAKELTLWAWVIQIDLLQVISSRQCMGAIDDPRYHNYPPYQGTKIFEKQQLIGWNVGFGVTGLKSKYK